MPKHKEKNENHYSVMLVPPNRRTTVSLRIPGWLFISGVATFILAIIFTGVSLYTASHFGVEMVRYKALKKKMVQQDLIISSFDDKVEDLKDDIRKLYDKENEIQAILAPSKSRSKGYSKYIQKKNKTSRNSKKLSKDFKAFKPSKTSDAPSENILLRQLTLLTEHSRSLDKSLGKHLSKTLHIRNIYASTPSIWPVLYGYIKSGYGQRRHPILKKRIMHNGIDIPSWWGAPVRATADGAVYYAGWSGTYGNVIVLSHDNGYKTLYAHTTQILVKNRDKVRKGQVIAQVGATGLATGVHLHYEVIRWKRHLNPEHYLDLDIFTASRKT